MSTEHSPAQPPQMTMHETSLSAYLRSVPHVLPTALSREMDALFSTSSAESIVVCDESERVLGLVMKTHFYQHLGQRFGVQIYLGRSVALLMDPHPLVVSDETAPADVIDLALSRPEDQFYDAVVITHKERFAGILTMRDVLSMSRMAAFTSEGKLVLERVVGTIETFLALNVRQQTRIAALERRIESIQEISQVIAKFAGQSRLLTLNAHIEAARSGQIGRGFGVIADEIGQLSERTRQHASEVQTAVHDIIRDIRDLVALNGEAQQLNAQRAESIDTALQVFQHLFTSVSVQADNVDQIRAYADVATSESIRVKSSLEQVFER